MKKKKLLAAAIVLCMVIQLLCAFGQRKQLAPPVKDHLDAPHGQRPFGYRCKRIVAQHPVMPDIRNECRCGLYDSE